MDTAVGLVQAYLHVNGYFTVAEYPVLEAFRNGDMRAVTDLDILAFRFAGAGHDVIRGRGRRPLAERARVPDPLLNCPADRPDMIVGEVKEGAARLNAAMRDPAVLEVALVRFGCCPSDHAAPVTRQLLTEGHATTPTGHAIRMIAFGDSPDGDQRELFTTVSMRHVVVFLRAYLRDNWAVLRHTQFRDSTFGVLALIEKWGADPPDVAAPDTPATGRPGRGRTVRERRRPRRMV